MTEATEEDTLVALGEANVVAPTDATKTPASTPAPVASTTSAPSTTAVATTAGSTKTTPAAVTAKDQPAPVVVKTEPTTTAAAHPTPRKIGKAAAEQESAQSP